MLKKPEVKLNSKNSCIKMVHVQSGKLLFSMSSYVEADSSIPLCPVAVSVFCHECKGSRCHHSQLPFLMFEGLTINRLLLNKVIMHNCSQVEDDSWSVCGTKIYNTSGTTTNALVYISQQTSSMFTCPLVVKWTALKIK